MRVQTLIQYKVTLIYDLDFTNSKIEILHLKKFSTSFICQKALKFIAPCNNIFIRSINIPSDVTCPQALFCNIYGFIYSRVQTKHKF